MVGPFLGRTVFHGQMSLLRGWRHASGGEVNGKFAEESWESPEESNITAAGPSSGPFLTQYPVLKRTAEKTCMRYLPQRDGDDTFG